MMVNKPLALLLCIATVAIVGAANGERKGGKMKRGKGVDSSDEGDICDPVDLTSDKSSDVSFELICTGSTGGAKLTDMTGYVLRHANSEANMIQLEGGTQMQGLEIAAQCGHFDDLAGIKSGMDDFSKAQLAWRRIIGQMVSHPHMDHISDFIVMSQELPFGGNFPVYARETVLQDMETHVFNFRIWPDFFNIGFSPNNNTLIRAPLEPFTPVFVANLGLSLTAFPLNHENPGGSTAFLVEDPKSGAAFLSIFDTSPDSIATANGELLAIWDYVAPLYLDGRLKGVMMESSFKTEISDSSLFGHLTPCYVLQELRSLASAAGVDTLDGLNVLIMHIKWKVLDADFIETVRNEFDLEELDNLQGTCAESNDLGVLFTFVEQGGRYLL
jgi:3',5'-cyclic-nucleotide phosphodiesterase